jgi:hypothetical protein
MKKSIKVALLSGLVFPGIGHMVLKQYLRGSILILSALLALSVIVVVATRRALSVVDSMTSGEIPVDAGAITELASSSMSGADNSLVNYSLVVLGVCWIVGIIDSYRLGSSQEK